MKINRIIHPGFWFGKSGREQALSLAARGVGGFCIYGGTAEEIKDLTAALRAAAPNRLIISADYEDGLGRWLKEMPLLPSNISIGAAASGGADLAYKKGLLTACAARDLGVDWVLAPDVDLADTPQNPIVNTRSFGRAPKAVAELAKHFIFGLQDGGCLNSLKHFPGHGATDTDSHLSLPTLNRSFKQMDNAELVPYKRLLTRADSIMVSHLLVKDWDGGAPASFSAKIMTDYLRGALHYKGAAVTDALMMGAMKGLNAVDCFKAGADILLAPGEPQKLLQDLQAAVNADPALVKRAADAISAQETMIAKLNTLTPRACGGAVAARALSLETALACVAAVGAPVRLEKNAEISYIEPDIYPSRDFKALEFLRELKKNKIKIKPYREGDRPACLIALTMASCGAFRGHVNFSAEQRTLLNKAAAASKKSVLVGLGSPFVNIGLEGLTLFLMAGTKTEAFQHTCAQILLGRLEPKGKMPV
jgi:beta-glucosidase